MENHRSSFLDKEKWNGEMKWIVLCSYLFHTGRTHRGCYASWGKKGSECYQTWIFKTKGKSFVKHSSIDFMHEIVLLISKMQSACCYKKKSLSIKYSRGGIKMYGLLLV